MRQRNNRVGHSDVPLQEWQSERAFQICAARYWKQPQHKSSHFPLISFVTSQPVMDCAVCYKAAEDQIEPNPKPYVHCIQKPRLTQVFMSYHVITIYDYYYYFLCDCEFFLITRRSLEKHIIQLFCWDTKHLDVCLEWPPVIGAHFPALYAVIHPHWSQWSKPNVFCTREEITLCMSFAELTGRPKWMRICYRHCFTSHIQSLSGQQASKLSVF